MKTSITKSVALSVILIVASVQPALAYIDPNTGGMLFQILAASFATLSAVLLIFSRQVRTLFARIRRAVRSRSGGDGEAAPGGANPALDDGQVAETPEDHSE